MAKHMTTDEIIKYEKDIVTIRDNDWLDDFSNSLVLAERKRCLEIVLNYREEEYSDDIIVFYARQAIAQAIEKGEEV